MLNITIQTIPHHEQRYPTVGDYYYTPDGKWRFFISDLGDWRMELCVAVHELVECALCRYAGIPIQDIDLFDMQYEQNRQPDDDSEPGDSPRAPYHQQHCVATGVERFVVALLGLKWKEYEDRINSL